MKRMFTGLSMSFGMFSRVPVPHVWDEAARPVMTLFLPVVGLVLGLLWYGLAELFAWLSLPLFITAAVLTIFPYLFTGFMHLDGFMDCSDAIMSRRTLEEKQKILKDSGAGTFSVVSFGLLLLICFALFASVRADTSFLGLIFIPVASRACAGLGVLSLQPIGHSQYAESFGNGGKTGRLLLLAELAVCLIAAWLLGGYGAFWPALTAAVFCWLSVLYARGQLGGMAGDVAGYGITIGEACALAVFILI